MGINNKGVRSALLYCFCDSSGESEVCGVTRTIKALRSLCCCALTRHSHSRYGNEDFIG